MADVFTTQERSEIMSRIRSANTKPEWILRSALHRLGFRFRLRDRRLPGSPDVILPKYRTVVFVHGCFWHRHAGCKLASNPKSNSAFWEDKFRRNVERDQRNLDDLHHQGWNTSILWECQLKSEPLATIDTLVRKLRAHDRKPARYDYATEALDPKTLLAVAEKQSAYGRRTGKVRKP